jgi:hypothetical protein
MPTGLPESLLQFVQAFVPTYQAAELLLFFAANPGLDFTPEEVVSAMRPVVVAEPAVREYTAHFAAKGLLFEREGRYRYGASPELERSINELVSAYRQRPVTLIRAIYQIADTRIQSFADAFRLRDDES